jgi:putative tryptophan/tyrosine transport system substrate-binding protein
LKRVLLLMACLLISSATLGEERVWRLGVLTPGDWPTSSLHLVMVPELARRGFVEGRNLTLFTHWGSGENSGELARAAETLATTKPDVIVAVSLPAVQAAQRAAPTTPIVAAFVDDPVSDGLATSLSHPGGTVTGIAMLASDGDKKRLEMLHDAIPAAGRFGYLVSEPRTGAAIEAMKRTAATLGVEIMDFGARSAADYQAAFDAMRDARVDGVVIGSSPVFFRDAAELAALAAARKLPTACEWREMAAAGCLIGYGPDLNQLRLRTADFVVRLFAGDKPAEMPFEQPTRFEMGINNKVARSIGVALPQSLLVRADEVIE